jgi:RimJ/RimL family protein N-acetyltransferase
MFEIQKATRQDYKSIAVSLRNRGIPYITPSHAEADIKNGNLYIIKENGKPIAQCALVYEENYHYHAMKRLIIYNKKNCGQGIAKAFVEYFVKQKYKKLGCTPWRDNSRMISILLSFGFEYQYTFLENYCYFAKKERG